LSRGVTPARASISGLHGGALDALTDPRAAIALYDGEIAWTDRQLGRLLQWLDDTGRTSSTLVVVVGRQGMRLDEDPLWFSPSGPLSDGLIRVPLALRLPGVVPRGTRLDTPIVLEDVRATLRDLLGVAGDDPDGVSLRQAWAGIGVPRTHAVLTTREGAVWRQPGLLVRWSVQGGYAAVRHVHEGGEMPSPGRLSTIMAELSPEPPTAAEVQALVRRLQGEVTDPAGLRPTPSAD